MERVVAWNAPETARSYAAYRRGGLRWFAGGLTGLALAIGLSAYALLVLQRPGLGPFIFTSLILGLIGIGTGLGALLRARRFRMALQRAPWRSAELRVAGAHLRLILARDGLGFSDEVPGLRGPGADVADQDDPDEERRRSVDVRLMTTSRWRVREVVGFRDREVRLCPINDGSFVLTAPGLDNLYGLQRLARRNAAQRA
ncbi:MAG: hypothetical protein M3313_01530 [Actinomycetota bacterium]|nr:hypothetical protein [Actinomycetota bacterium]